MLTIFARHLGDNPSDKEDSDDGYFPLTQVASREDVPGVISERSKLLASLDGGRGLKNFEEVYYLGQPDKSELEPINI